MQRSIECAYEFLISYIIGNGTVPWILNNLGQKTVRFHYTATGYPRLDVKVVKGPLRRLKLIEKAIVLSYIVYCNVKYVFVGVSINLPHGG